MAGNYNLNGEKELTPEEMEEERKTNVKKSLESVVLQEAYAGNTIKSQPHIYGQIGHAGGEAAYNSAMNSDEAKKIREGLYTQKYLEGKKAGVAGEPVITNYDISMKLMQQINEVLSIAKISELEKYAKAIGAKLDFKVPEELKNVDLYKLPLDKEGKLDEEKLSEKQADALNMKIMLDQAYKNATIKNATEKAYFFEANQFGKEIQEKYGPKEKAKK